MLNRYSVTPKVDARTTNNYSLDFNAVSGTLCKSHPRSIFVWFQHGSDLEKRLMGPNPTYRFDFEKEKKYTSYDRVGLPESHYGYVSDEEPVVLLQMMLTGENRVIAEIVRADDFEVSVDG